MRGRARAGHGEDRALENLLDRKAVLLPLPADERRAVIFEGELKARHSEPGGVAAGSGGDGFVENLVDARIAAAGDIEAQAAARLVGGAERRPRREHHLPRKRVAGDIRGGDALGQASPQINAGARLDPGREAMAAEILQRPPHGVGELPPQPVEMAPVSAFRQNAMQDVGPGRAVAHGRRELQIDKLRDPVLPRGDIAAAHRGADGLGGAADLHDPAQAVERGEPRRRLGLEICERVVLENENVVLLGEAQHAMDGRRRGRRPRRVMQAAGGQIEARAMLGEQAFEFRDVGAVGGHRDGDGSGRDWRAGANGN